MSRGGINMDNILNPHEAWDEFKKYLISLYTESYGEKYYYVIKKRISDTYYMFDSNPVDTYNFYRKNNLSIGFGFMNRIEREYKDYLSIEKKVDEKLTNKYKEYLSSCFKVIPDFMPFEFLTLDYESFSFENMNKLNSPFTCDELRRSILTRQNNYINFCNYFRFMPITDPYVIEQMIKVKTDMENEKFTALVNDTIWGKRLKKDIFEKTGLVIDSKTIASVVFNKKSCASVNLLKSVDGRDFRMCFFPIMKNFGFNLDKTFFHENRHVVECGNDISGFTSAKTGEYRLINELRTQENAISDAYNFRMIPLFSNTPDPAGSFNTYEALMNYSGPFIRNYLYLLNQLGINNACYDLEYLFGKNNLSELENYLNETNVSILRGFFDKIDFDRQKRLSYYLDSHFASRHS